jgi:hypothetical protein
VPHLLTELAVVITEELTHTIVLIWRDASIRIIFESGGKMDVASPGDLDAAIHILTSPPSPLSSGQYSIHRVPPDATNELQVLEWMQTIPGVSVEFRGEGRA